MVWSTETSDPDLNFGSEPRHYPGKQTRHGPRRRNLQPVEFGRDRTLHFGMQNCISACMTDHEAEQKVSDELAKQPKDDDDTEAKENSKQRRSAAEKQLNDSKQLKGSTKI
jgi:hypothetical protein